MGTLDRSLWLDATHSKNESGKWVCPECGKSSLSLNQKDVIEVTSAYSNKCYEHEDFDHEWLSNYYTCVFKCSNESCGESVVSCGNASSEVIHEYIQGRNHEYIKEVLEPSFFVPPLKLFYISQMVKEEIRNQIERSFSHFFNDTSAAANSIRTALEFMMNDQKVRKSTISVDNKRVQIKLHARIDIFGKKNKELKPFLIAAKWIGNAGSHISNVTKEDLLDGYELLEHCIDELYDKPARMKELSAKAKSINTRKKPRSTKKTK